MNSSSVRLSSTTILRPEVDPLLQLGGIDAFGAVMVFNPFAERFGGHVDAGEQFVAGGLPCPGAAVQHRDVGAADTLQPGGQFSARPRPSSTQQMRDRRRGSSARARISFCARLQGIAQNRCEAPNSPSSRASSSASSARRRARCGGCLRDALHCFCRVRVR